MISLPVTYSDSNCADLCVDFVASCEVFLRLRKKNRLPRKIPPLPDYKKGRSGASAPFPSGHGREENMILCAKWGLMPGGGCGTRCRIHHLASHSRPFPTKPHQQENTK